MAALTVWQFDAVDGADRAARLLERLAHDDLAALYDAAVVEWDTEHRRPGARQLGARQLGAASSPGALGNGFWGLLFGLVFFVPLLGAAVGAPTGATADALADVGIDDRFINRIRDRVTPGTSALFLLTSTSAVPRIQQALAGGPSELIVTEIDSAHEAALRTVFGD